MSGLAFFKRPRTCHAHAHAQNDKMTCTSQRDTGGVGNSSHRQRDDAGSGTLGTLDGGGWV